jgi:exodeoxyribonuclease VII small subunit
LSRRSVGKTVGRLRDRDHAGRTRSMPMPNSSPADAAPLSFESALAELEKIVTTMERGDLPLKESLVAYKRGAELLQFCQSALKDVEQQVKVLERGVLKAFETEASPRADTDER